MQIDWWTLALQTINFVVVVWLLKRFLYQPVRRIIDKREAEGRELREKASQAQAAAETARLDFERRRAELDEDRRARETELHSEMEKERERILEAARAEAADMIAKAQERIEREQAEAIATLQDRIADLATGLARRALADGAASAEHDIERVAGYLDGLSDADRQELGDDLQGENCALAVASATDLPEATKDRWGTSLRARFGGGVRLSFETDPDILGGVELRFPHSVISFSVADRLDRAARGMRE